MKNLLFTVLLVAGVGAVARTTATASANHNDMATNAQGANVCWPKADTATSAIP